MTREETPAPAAAPSLGTYALGLVALAMVCVTVLVLVRGWPCREAAPADDRTRHAVCELLDTLGADATERADVDACTFTEGGS